MSRIVTIFGATGNQGSSVLESILADGTFKPRAVTRDPSSKSSQKLKSLGVEVVQGDVTGDVESIRNAIRGSEVVFAITQPSLHGNTQVDEFEQGKNLVDASKAENIKFFVWSSLGNAKKVSGGKYAKITPFDLKAEVDEYLAKSGLFYAIVYTGWFVEDLWHPSWLHKTNSGALELAISKWIKPETLVPFTWVKRDLGRAVLALVKDYDTTNSRVLNSKYLVVTENISFSALADRLSKGLGKPVEITELSSGGIEFLDQMWQFQEEFGIYSGAAVPDPNLVALGVTFDPLGDDFISEAKSRGL